MPALDPDVREQTAAPPRARGARAPKGEGLVWLTSVGLTLGLMMIVGLLAVIVGSGLPVFWPKRVAQLELSDVGDGTPGRVIGEIVKVQESKGTERHREIQLFVGNKPINPLSFRYVREAAVTATSQPAELLMVERREYGDAMGAPVKLAVAHRGELPAQDPEFLPTLERLVEAAAERWERIEEIEKVAIGAINLEMNELGYEEKRLAGRGGDARRSAEIAARRAALQAEYEKLAAQAKELRAQQVGDKLVLRIDNGQESSIAVGNIVDVFEPNRVGFLARAGRFVGNMWAFVTERPREANTEGGIWPAIFGTFVMTLLMSIAVVPFGVIAAIYLREYAKQGPVVRAVRIAVNNLAGVPSIVFGVFGLGFFVYFCGGKIDDLFFAERLPTPTYGTGGIIWASLTLALMTVPVVIVATEESIAAVPRGMKEGSLALGASKWQTIRGIVLPSAAPGILTGLILAMARGAGEVAPLMLVGVVKLAPSLPIDGSWLSTDLVPFVHLDRKFMHLGFHIYDLGFQSPDSEAAKPMVFATTLLLITLVLVLNLAAIILRQRLRKRFATGVF